MLVSLPCYKLLEKYQFALCGRDSMLQFIRLCLFGHNQFFHQWACTTLPLCCIIQSDILNVYHHLAHLFCSFYLSFPALHKLQRLSVVIESSSLVIYSFWCGYHYGCYPQSLGFLFSYFWVIFVPLWNLIGPPGSCTNAAVNCFWFIW